VIALDDLRRYAIARSLFPSCTLEEALARFGFVQADPIRAPARAQDLILRHRVIDYRNGGIDRQYESLDIAEDVFINYGYVTRSLQQLMHPRPQTGVPAEGHQPWPPRRTKLAKLILAFIRERGPIHPREVEAHFAQGKVQNWFGGSSNATTQLLEAMHYRGMLRVHKREGGTRIYTAHEHTPPADLSIEARLDALADVAIRIYAPLTTSGLSFLLRRLRHAAPQWRAELPAVVRRARQRLNHTNIDKIDWYWPAGEDPLTYPPNETVRLLAPFDPIVWDRGRFELFWNWTYRFEAYTPAPKRIRGYYALPMLWRDQVIGWANVTLKEVTVGYIKSEPRDRAFKRELKAELNRVSTFLS
jgi:uncharacterized protein YcaQ